MRRIQMKPVCPKFNFSGRGDVTERFQARVVEAKRNQLPSWNSRNLSWKIIVKRSAINVIMEPKMFKD